MKFFKTLILTSMIIFFTGCGGGGSGASGGSNTAPTINITPQTVAIDIIIAYADDNTQPSPTVGDYSDADIIGVNADNLVNVNIAVDALIGTDVDTIAEIQAVVDEVIATLTAKAASDAVLLQIGSEADDPDSVNSIVTVVQLSAILPALTDINSTNETAYQDYIDTNPNAFSNPATPAEVQAMLDAVNVNQAAISASDAVLVQIGAEGDTGDTTNSIVTAAQLGDIQGLTGVVVGNETAYQDYIDNNPDAFSSPATLAEVQAMVDAVNAEQAAIAASEAVLSQIGLEADDSDSVNSIVTVAQLSAILPALTDINSTNETAYQDYIDAHPDAFSNPATEAEVQAMLDAVNTTNIVGSLDNTFGKSGILDTTFDLDGIVTHSNIVVLNSSEAGNAIISDSSGNIYVAGFSTNGTNTDMAIWKYTSKGILDNTFGTDGTVVYDSGSQDNAYGITLDSLGNVYVTGSNDGNMAIWKYTKNGIKDATFGTNGLAVYDSVNVGTVGNAITLDRTGSVYVTGYIINSIGNKDMAIWKYTSDGILDNTFSYDGMVRHNFHVSGESNQVGYGITSDSSGNVYVSGYQAFTSNGSTANMVIWKYTSDGIKDTTFGSSGIAMRSGSGRGIILDSLGNVYVTGYNGVNMTIWKYTNDGITDTTFGSNGIVSTLGTGYGITLNSSGSIYVTGVNRNSAGNNDMAIWKYTSTGTLDSNFGTGGIVIHHNAAGGDGHDRGNAITLDKEGSVYVTGSSYNRIGTYDMVTWKYSSSGIVVHDGAAGGYKTDVGNAITYDRFGNVYVTGFSWSSSSSSIDMATWKYTSSGVLDTSFGTGGIVTQSGTAVGGSDQGNGITVDNMGNIYVTGSVQSTSGESIMAIWKYTSNGTLDTSFGTDGMVKYINASVGNAITLDNFGNIYVTGHGKVSSSEVYSHMIIWKYTNDGVLDTSFSGDGVVAFNNDNMPDRGYGIVVDSTHVYVTGYTGYNGNIDMSIWKCTTNGVLDSTFGIDGNGMVKYINANVDFGRGIKLDSAGNILVTGYSHNSAGNDDMVIWKYSNDGTSDTSFGTNGSVVHNNAAGGNGDDRGYEITLDSLDNIYVTGYSLNSIGNNDMAIWKYSNDGTSDITFGTFGIVVHHNAAGGDSADVGNAITLDNSGGLYVTGYSANGSNADMVIWKYLSGIPSEIIALDKIKAYADDNTQPSPTVEDYANAGITGVNAGNITFINTAIDALVGIDVDTVSEIQAVVDEVNAAIASNNGLVRYVSTCNELRSALVNAQYNNYNDIIVLTDGTYSTECDGLGTFQYSDWQDYNLTLEGSHKDNVIITGEDISKVFSFISTATDAKLLIRNMTIRNGNDTTSSLSNGAGIYAEIPQIEIQNSSILSNGGERWGVVRGGGLYLKSSQSVYFKNTSITGNALKSYKNNRGAGAYISSPNIVIEDCNITSNSISQTNGATANGGGLALSGGMVDINNTIISGNSLYSQDNHVIGAGAMIGVTSQLTINNSKIENNKATGSGSTTDTYGGGLYLFGPSKITNTLVKSNRTFTDDVNTDSYAGGIYANNLIIENSILYGNSSEFYAYPETWGTDFGGAIYNAGTVTLVNTLVHSGVNVTALPLGINPDYGIFNSANSVLTVVNTIFDNTPITGDTTAYGSFDNSIVYRSSISTIINDRNNVSYSSPNYIDASIQDFHPASDSISIDKGLTSYIGVTIPNSDLDGNIRPQGITIDIGPYEFLQTPEETSDAVLAQIGNEGDIGDTTNSVVTIAQLSAILPPLTGIYPANETIYQDYIDANPDLFSTPATQAEVQDMIDTVNALPTRLPSGISINSASLQKAIGSIIDTTPYTIDVQGKIDTNGLTVSVPYTVVDAPVTLPAYSTTFEIDSGHTEDGEVGIIATFAWAEQTNLPVGSGTFNATITIDDSNASIPDDIYNAKKLDIQDDIDGIVVATFLYPTDNTLGTGTLTLKIYPGIPDRMFGQPDNNGDTTTHMFLYLPVTNPITGKTWLNNNLGANYANINSTVFNIEQQATVSNDYNAYGSLFQWGRKADGHELIIWTDGSTGAGKYGATSLPSANPTHALFIKSIWAYWGNGSDFLWAKESSENNVCPIGYRVPAIKADLEEEMLSWGNRSDTGALSSDLKLSMAGYRSGISGEMINGGLNGRYWSNTPSSDRVQFLYFYPSFGYREIDSRTQGFSVRCIKDSI